MVGFISNVQLTIIWLFQVTPSSNYWNKVLIANEYPLAGNVLCWSLAEQLNEASDYVACRMTSIADGSRKNSTSGFNQKRTPRISSRRTSTSTNNIQSAGNNDSLYDTSDIARASGLYSRMTSDCSIAFLQFESLKKPSDHNTLTNPFSNEVIPILPGLCRRQTLNSIRLRYSKDKMLMLLL